MDWMRIRSRASLRLSASNCEARSKQHCCVTMAACDALRSASFFASDHISRFCPVPFEQRHTQLFVVVLPSFYSANSTIPDDLFELLVLL